VDKSSARDAISAFVGSRHFVIDASPSGDGHTQTDDARRLRARQTNRPLRPRLRFDAIVVRGPARAGARSLFGR
jgi:hypothetical protein